MNPMYTKAASFAIMPLMAAGGYAGYSYSNNNYPPTTQQYPSQSQMVCTTLSTDLYYGYSNNTNDVANMQQFFVARGYLRGRVNGQFDQATLTALRRFQSENGLSASGYADTATRSRIQQISCNGGGNPNPNPYPTQGQLSVQGVDAPAQLTVNQSGSYTVRVSGWNTYSGGQLHYSVVWGDENAYGASATAYYPAPTVNSTGTFTHIYVTPGTYKAIFTVTDDYGHTTQASVSTRVIASNGYYNTGNTGGYGSGTNCSNYYDRNCYGSNSSNNNGGYNTGGNTGGYNSGTVTCASYYDRNCYNNGQYTGPSYGGGSTYNGPGDTCYFLNGQWQGNCGTNNTNGGYYGSNNNGGYVNTLGGPNGVDYSCYYDRACNAGLQGRTY